MTSIQPIHGAIFLIVIQLLSPIYQYYFGPQTFFTGYTNLSVSASNYTEEDPWLNGFGYRKPITLSSSTTLSNYPVLIKTDTASLIAAGKMQADCDDIRFTSSDGYTKLDYWLDPSTCNTANTWIWVKVPSIGASTTIYMYYGNSVASNQANGDNVFLFFDDFSSGTLSSTKWTLGYGANSGPTYTITSGVLHIYSSTGLWNVIHSNYNVGTTSSVVAYARQRIGGVDMWQFFSAFVVNAYPWDDNRFGLGEDGSYGWNRNTVDVNYRVDGGAYSRLALGTSSDVGNNWFRAEIGRTSSSSFYAKLYDDAGNLLGSQSLTNTGWSDEAFWWSSWVQDSQGTYIDYIFIKPYVATEPSYSIGSEESFVTMAGDAGTWSWKVPSNGDRIRSGNAASWSWVVFQDDGSAITSPVGSASSWQWYP